ncbi:MAG: helix-turn-helix domain-containing protein [Candidatus Subteraquimicrobiales bacterium]|nr:helix-turn-helix domain-containing protein [Candidatus Subteraquimicrobiales bacterium]
MEKLLGIEDIANIVGVKKSTVYQWTHRGLIPVVRLSSRCVKFSEAAIEKWLQGKSSPAAPQTPQTETPPPKTKKRRGRATENISSNRITDIVARAKKEVIGK